MSGPVTIMDSSAFCLRELQLHEPTRVSVWNVVQKKETFCMFDVKPWYFIVVNGLKISRECFDWVTSSYLFHQIPLWRNKEPTKIRLAPNLQLWLRSSVGSSAQLVSGRYGFKPRRSLIFLSGFIFSNLFNYSLSAMIYSSQTTHTHTHSYLVEITCCDVENMFFPLVNSDKYFHVIVEFVRFCDRNP